MELLCRTGTVTRKVVSHSNLQCPLVVRTAASQGGSLSWITVTSVAHMYIDSAHLDVCFLGVLNNLQTRIAYYANAGGLLSIRRII